MANDRIVVVDPDGLPVETVEPGVTRRIPFEIGDALLTVNRIEPGAELSWHRHGENIYVGYVVDGRSETEYGPDGGRVAEIHGGEFFHVPPGLVHRDTNPTDGEHEGIVWLCGGEPWVVNVDGPG